MRRTGKTAMVSLLSTAMIMGNIGGANLFAISMKQANAKEITYVELNEEFGDELDEDIEEIYFQLPTCGSVRFLNRNGVTVDQTVSRVEEDGNLTEVASTINTEAVRLGIGTYKIEKENIVKIVFNEEDENSYEQEWNDTIDDANVINPNTVYTGKLNYYERYFGMEEEESYDVDYYKIILDSPGKMYVQYTVQDISTGFEYDQYKHNENVVTLYKEDEDGNIDEISEMGGQNSENITRYSERYRVPKGTYYVSVKAGDNNWADITDYQLKVNYTAESAQQYEQEYNDSKDTANKISINNTYIGNIAEDTDVDYYTFSLDKKSKVKLKTQVPRQCTDKLFKFGIYNSNGTSKIAEVKSGTNPTSYTTEKELDPGDYYVIVKKGEVDNTESVVDYSFQVMATEIQEIVATEIPEPDEEQTTVSGIVETQRPLITSVPTFVPTLDDDDYDDGYDGDYDDEIGSLVTQLPAQNVQFATTRPSETTTAPLGTDTVRETLQPTTTPIATTYQPTKVPGRLNSGDENDTSTNKILVKSIELFPDTEMVEVGDELNISVEVLPENATNPDYVLTSSNKKVISIDEDGILTAKKAGTAVITATATDGSEVYGECEITVEDDRSYEKVTSSKITVPKVTLKNWKKTSKKNARTVRYKISWNKTSKATGYEVKEAVQEIPGIKWDSYKYTTKKTSHTYLTSRLHYRVKISVRAYRIVGGKKYYGKWSQSKTTLIKF